MNQDDAIAQLLAKDQIRHQMAVYARGIDRRDEGLLRQVYHEDSFDDHGWGLQATGPEFATLVRPDGNGFPLEWKSTMHLLGQHLIEVDGATARSEVYYYSIQISEHDGNEVFLSSAGRYLDEWRRGDDGVFRITRRRVTYDWVRTDEVPTPWPGPDPTVPKMFFDGPAMDGTGTHFGISGPTDVSYDLFPDAARV